MTIERENNLVLFGIAVWLTYHAFSRERPPRAEAEAARRLPRPTVPPEGAICSRRDAVRPAKNEGLQPRASERPLVGCYAELDGDVALCRSSRGAVLYANLLIGHSQFRPAIAGHVVD
jgi:hypothetical protein